MTEEEYRKKYENKTIKYLCNKWKEYYIKKYKEWDDADQIQIINKITDDSIIKFGLSKIIEELKDEKN